jgi:hypothetical protein
MRDAQANLKDYFAFYNSLRRINRLTASYLMRFISITLVLKNTRRSHR